MCHYIQVIIRKLYICKYIPIIIINEKGNEFESQEEYIRHLKGRKESKVLTISFLKVKDVEKRMQVFPSTSITHSL